MIIWIREIAEVSLLWKVALRISLFAGCGEKEGLRDVDEIVGLSSWHKRS